ncbi:MAG: aldehyde dehydrogenase [Sphingobium sp.]|uniref:aldehyde dehydrogenase family protein n=1 Tax=Sphingobium sp. TaxID=1912891 RepID=UPI000DAFA9A4|nr:aldehyde dehydrogenase family protein [Sphingobium sp.]PZU07610.1 MAG: aldehyde dehydrogenase [Sphingobium sp.]
MNDRSVPTVHLHIGDEKRTTGSGGTHHHIYPADASTTGTVPLAGAEETDEAVAAAANAFATWRRSDPRERARMLRRLADLVRANAQEFGRLGALDNGTPAMFAMFGATIAADWIDYYAGWADRIEGQVNGSVMARGELGYTLAEPYGVIGLIITWNGPLISLGMKVAPAIAAGNTVVVKPSEMTPYSGEFFMQLAAEAGIPAGVINMVPGSVAAGEALVRHKLVEKVSFTGGPVTARKILASCAEQIKPAVLELGGKSANLIFPDADLDPACAFGVDGSIGMMSGQGCAFPTRMLVHQDIYDEVVERTLARVAQIKVGDPFAPETTSGPVVNEAALHRILATIDRAKADGAGKLVAGGNRIGGALASGYYIEPTVFTDVDPDSHLAQEEVFGPVLAITRFKDEAEAIRIANNTDYGLSAYIQTRDLGRALRLSEELRSGVVLVNGSQNIQPQRPFGGLGVSGYGREGGKEGLAEFLRVKTVGIAMPAN